MAGHEIDIVVASELSQYRIDIAKIKQITNKLADKMQLPTIEIVVSFVTDNEICKLNKRFRLIDRPTDVLSFPQLEFCNPVVLGEAPEVKGFALPGRLQLGDIVLAPDVALGNAESIGQGIDREICFLIVHGLLHLCGHDHMQPAEEKLMLDQQKKIFTELDLESGSAIWARCVEVV